MCGYGLCCVDRFWGVEMAERAGRQLGNYRLLSIIGQGGFAEVYLGEHIYLDTTAAIKVLYTQLDSDDIDHFQSEARTVARLIHPNIVRVLDYGVADRTPYLVVDYAPNGTLRKRYAKGTQLPLPTVVAYVNQLAAALQYAHDQGVIHRDVKPENMLLGRRNEVLLSDFGIAVVAESSHRHSMQGVQDLAGTIAYMAPEQIQSRAGPASDQYSLGIVVYEWLCGTRPFHGSFPEIAVKHTLSPPPPLRESRPTLPQEVEEVVMRSLAKKPEERFASVEDFARALQRTCAAAPTLGEGDQEPTAFDQSARPAETIVLSQQGETLETVPLGAELAPTTTSLTHEAAPSSVETSSAQQLDTKALPAQTSKRGLSRRAVMVGLGGLALAGALGGVGWLAYMQVGHGLRAAPSQSSGAPTALYTFRGHTSWVWSVAWAPAGVRIASAGGDGTVQVWDATTGDHLNVYSRHRNSVYSVAWSPDGMRVASGSYDKTVQVWDATYGDHFLTYTGHTSWVWSVAWAPNGKHIASAGGDKTVQIWSAENGRHIYTYTGHADFVNAVAWSPDSQQIASASNDGTVQVWKALDGRPLYTYQTNATPMWSVAWSPDGERIVSASSDGTAQVWDARNGAHLYVYHGHTDFVYAVAWSPNGRRIASAGDDKTVQLWDAAYGNNPYTYRGHTSSVRSVSWSRDSLRVASGSWDTTVQVWQAR
jgi:WD40 repeat protein/tRNA A-37 threonylcarbamoyl transferase component Bud32